MTLITTIAILLTGFTATVSQIIYLREFLTVFYGNELSIAVILACWLVGGSFGSIVLARMAAKFRAQRSLLAFAILVLSALLPLNILAIRSIRAIASVNPGEIIGYSTMLGSSLAVLVPTCAVLGLIFSLACRVYASVREQGPAAIGAVYVLEAAGALAGGVIASFLLIPAMSPLHIMACLSVLMASAALAMAFAAGGPPAAPVAYLAAGLAFSQLWGLGSGIWQRLDADSTRLLWRGQQVVQSTNTIYGNIALIKNMSQYTFFDNGLHLYTVPGGNVAEEAAHFAMLAHPDPKRVLLIGGGVGGIAAEALQHGVTAVDYVELDPMIIKMAKERLPAGYLRSLDDRRLRIFFEDGRAYIKRARELYDVIIVSLGEPYNAMINRFYTREFYEEARSALSDGGILSFGLGASESYLGAQARDFLSSINATLSSAFREVYVITGETAYFLASGREGAFDDYYRTIMKRSADRALAPRYFIHDNLFPRFSSGSAGSMQRAISDGSRGMLNRDFRPISYYYDIVYWSSRFRGDLLSGVMKRIDGYGVGIGAAIALGLLAVSGFINSRFRGSLRRSAIASVAANGFSQITFQVLILISFQALYGYMFYKLGMIISAFMAGLAIGGYWAVRSMAKLGDGKLALVKAQASLAFYAMAIIAALWAARIMPSGRVGADIIFGILPLISGVIGGRLFTIAGRIMYAGNAEAGISGGLNYGVELLGSCVGAVLAATVFVPVIGIPATCLLIAGFNAVVLIWPACGKAETIYQS